MMDCWLEDPSERPSFEELKEKFEAFSNDKTLLIQFPKGRESNYPYASTIATEPSDSKPGDFTSLSMSQRKENLLEIGMGMRRISSEPTLDSGGMDEPMGDQERESDLKRSLSNPYVRTPRRDSRFDTRQNKQFVWNQEIPRVLIIPAAVNEDN